MAQWVYRKSDFLWCVLGADDPAKIHTQPEAYGLLDVPGETPDPRLERADPASPTKRRAATAQEIAAYDDAVTLELVYERALKAAVAATIRETTGSFPNAATADRLKGYFKTAWKALG